MLIKKKRVRKKYGVFTRILLSPFKRVLNLVSIVRQASEIAKRAGRHSLLNYGFLFRSCLEKLLILSRVSHALPLED